MWVIAQSGEVVNISEARWIDCVPEPSEREFPATPPDDSALWIVQIFFTGREKGPLKHILYRGDAPSAKAVLHGLITLTGAYSLKSLKGYGSYPAVAEDPDVEGGRVYSHEEPVLKGRETLV